MSLLDLIYGLRMHNDLDFQIDKDVARKQYEKERAAAGGLRKQAFAITDKVLEEAEEGKLLPGSGKYGRSYRLRGDLYRYMAQDKSLWYDTLLKRVDNIETNLSTGERLNKYASKRGRSKGMYGIFGENGEFGGSLNFARNRAPGGELSITDGVGI